MSNVGLELLYAFRGVPDKCDACGTLHDAKDLEPEEGGIWVCHACLIRWRAQEKAAWLAQKKAAEQSNPGESQ